MDHNKFDEIAKQFASGRSRRSFLKSIGVAAVSAVAGAVGLGNASAATRGPGTVCRKNGDCDSGICAPPDRYNRQYCVCPPTQVVCAGTCVDPLTAYKTDKKNCGACGVACKRTDVCCDGKCIAPSLVCNSACCTAEQTCYNNACCQPDVLETTCLNKCGPQTNNCGQSVNCPACCLPFDMDCSSNEQCCSGACVSGVCQAEIGGTGAYCDDGQDCTSGKCCGGFCVASDAYDSDVNNCGSCGNICPGQTDECQTVICVSGTCDFDYADLGTALASQTAEDCKKAVCDGAGGTTSQDDDLDVPTSTAGACTDAICTDGDPSNPPKAINTACGDGGFNYCDGEGTCVECTEGSQCGSGTCDSNVCCVEESESETCASTCGSVSNNCGNPVECGPCCTDTAGACESNSECCSSVCIDGFCADGTVIDGADCDEDDDCQSGNCCAGTCVATDAYDSDDTNCGTCGNVCTGVSDECATVACIEGVCGYDYTEAGTPVSAQTAGDCKKNVCNGTGGTTTQNDDTDVPTQTADCLTPTCSDGVAGTSPKPINTVCDEDGGTVCNASGICVHCNSNDQCGSNKCTSGVCCVADSDSTTCTGKCGSQTNNCGQTVDCGICCTTGTRKSTVGNYCVPDAATCNLFVSGANQANKDYRECDFSGKTFSALSVTSSNFTGASFAGATMVQPNFQKSNLTNVNFTGARITAMDFRGANLTGANFSTVTFVVTNSWSTTAVNPGPTICPDAVSITTGTCCSHMNGNTPTVCN